MRDFVAAARAIADPTRARILKLLEGGELCVCHIQERLGLAQSTASKHLRVLHDAGLVARRREGLWVHYRLETKPVTDCNLACLTYVAHSLNDDPRILADAAAATTPCPVPALQGR